MGSPQTPRSIVRLRPETWKRLASLRRPIRDSEGTLVGLESFDRVVQRLLEAPRSPRDRPYAGHEAAPGERAVRVTA